MSHVEIDRSRGALWLLTLNRPERRNALSMSLVLDLRAAVAEVDGSRECRVAILRGAGKGFCAGADLKGDDVRVPGTEGMSELGTIYKMQENLAQAVLALRECQKPVIAAVHGAAVGGGLALALACDVRLAAESAVFGSVFIRVGLSSCDVGVSYLLPRIVGAARAAELMLTGRHFDAREAERIGLVHRVVTDEALLGAALETAGQIAENSEYGVWMTKQGLWANLDAPSLRHAIELENRTQVLGTFTGNMSEAMHAFQERRAPRWKKL
jgi:enoyl-CoA hydratase